MNKTIKIKHMQEFLKSQGYIWKKEYMSENPSEEGFIKAKGFYQLTSRQPFTILKMLNKNKDVVYGKYIIKPDRFEGEIYNQSQYDSDKSSNFKTTQNLSSDWHKFLEKKGFDFNIDLNKVSTQKWESFAKQALFHLPKSYHDATFKIKILNLSENSQIVYITYTLTPENIALISFNKNENVYISLSNHQTLYTCSGLEVLWKNTLKELNDEILNNMIEI